jgi:hypothetical protein
MASLDAVERVMPDVEPFDAKHVLMTYPPTEQNPEGIRHIVRTEAIFSDEEVVRARQKRALLNEVMERASRIENPTVLRGLIRQLDEALIDGDQG